MMCEKCQRNKGEVDVGKAGTRKILKYCLSCFHNMGKRENQSLNTFI